MFKVDMQAVREAAIEARLMANPAKAANPASCTPTPLAKLEKLAISHHLDAEIDPTLAELLEAAMRACDHWQDGPAPRDAMRRDVLMTPDHLRADLMEHLTNTYASRGTSDEDAEGCNGC